MSGSDKAVDINPLRGGSLGANKPRTFAVGQVEPPLTAQDVKPQDAKPQEVKSQGPIFQHAKPAHTKGQNKESGKTPKVPGNTPQGPGKKLGGPGNKMGGPGKKPGGPQGGGGKGLRAGGGGKGLGAGGGGKGMARPQVIQNANVVSANVAPPAKLRRHHLGVLFAFLMLVLLPLGLTIFYLFGVAKDQYGSVTAFTVRQEESGSASDLIGGLDLFTGTGGSSDTDILFEYIQSQELVEIVDTRLDLRGHYEQYWDTDKAFSLWPDASTEDLVWFWKRVVRISYDQAAGLMEIEVRAFDPAFAQSVAREIVSESERMINGLSATAREESTGYAQADLDEALERLKTSREALTAFRTRSQIVDPETDIQGRMGVMNNLQQQLAEALIDGDLLAQTSSASDPRLSQATRRINVIRDRIASERLSFSQGADDVGALADDYPTLIAEFERLTVDREYAEETYRAALTAFDVARSTAIRRSRYLAAYIAPTLADSATYPQRYTLSALAGLFLLLSWAVIALVYYSLRDRR